MKKYICISLCLIIIFLLGSCVRVGVEDETEETTAAAAAAVQQARPVDGSYIFTAENMPVIGCTAGYERLAYAVAGAVLCTSAEQVRQFVKVSDSLEACYKSFIDGETQLMLAVAADRKLSELAYNADFLWKYTSLGRDALVFICYRGNALDNISLLNLRYLYQACYKNWSELGGYDTPMLIYGASDGSTSKLLFDTLFGVADENVQTEMTEYYSPEQGYFSARAVYTRQKGSIGCSSYNYCALGTKDVLSYSKMLSLDGVAPDRQNINSGAYPFVYDFGVLISDRAAADSPQGILYEWLCSEQGRQTVAAAGY